VNQKFAVPANRNGKEGAMDYLMYRFRYTFN